MKVDNKNGLVGWKTTELGAKIGKILLGSDGSQFWQIFCKIQRVIIFEPYEG